MSATEARRLIRRLQAEGYSEAQIAREACGDHSGNLLLRGSAVTVRRTLELRRFARLKLSEGDAHNQENDA